MNYLIIRFNEVAALAFNKAAADVIAKHLSLSANTEARVIKASDYTVVSVWNKGDQIKF